MSVIAKYAANKRGREGLTSNVRVQKEEGVLYNLFRKSVKDTEVAAYELIRVASPSPDEWTEDAKVYLPKLKEIHKFLVEASAKLPEELEGQENMFFNPRIPRRRCIVCSK